MHLYNLSKKLRTLVFILSVFNLSFTATYSIASESDFFKGVMGAIIVNGILQEVKKTKEPLLVNRQITYVSPYSTSIHNQTSSKTQQISYHTIPHKAFKAQLPTVRYTIQGELMKMGYYYGNLDGYWGIKTEHAVSSYARDTKQLHLLTSIRGANSLFNEIINTQNKMGHKSTQLNHKDEIVHLETQISSLLKEIKALELRILQLKRK